MFSVLLTSEFRLRISKHYLIQIIRHSSILTTVAGATVFVFSFDVPVYRRRTKGIKVSGHKILFCGKSLLKFCVHSYFRKLNG